jgi:hypothetical protein
MKAVEICELRLLLRDYFDANRNDWSPEILGPMVDRILAFVARHDDERSEVEELVAFLFIGADPGLEELLAALMSQYGFSGLEGEVSALGERRPRLVRSGHVRRLLEPFSSEVGRPGKRFPLEPENELF